MHLHLDNISNIQEYKGLSQVLIKICTKVEILQSQRWVVFQRTLIYMNKKYWLKTMRFKTQIRELWLVASFWGHFLTWNRALRHFTLNSKCSWPDWLVSPVLPAWHTVSDWVGNGWCIRCMARYCRVCQIFKLCQNFNSKYLLLRTLGNFVFVVENINKL